MDKQSTYPAMRTMEMAEVMRAIEKQRADLTDLLIKAGFRRGFCTGLIVGVGIAVGALGVSHLLAVFIH